MFKYRQIIVACCLEIPTEALWQIAQQQCWMNTDWPDLPACERLLAIGIARTIQSGPIPMKLSRHIRQGTDDLPVESAYFFAIGLLNLKQD